MSLEKLRQRVKKLQNEVETLETKVKTRARDKAKQAAKIQVSIFLKRILVPYLEGLCEGLDLSLQDGLSMLIRQGKPLYMLAMENQEAFTSFLQQPELRVFSTAASPLARVSDEWITDQTDALLEVAEETEPELAETINTTEGGREWLEQSLIGLRRLIFQQK